MEVKIGRVADNDIVVPASYVAVSKRHAKITQVDGAYYIEDLNSTNGTFVNDERLKPHEVKTIERGESDDKDGILVHQLCHIVVAHDLCSIYSRT